MPLLRLLAVLTSELHFIPDRPLGADMLYFFICAESIRREIMKSHINARRDPILIIFQALPGKSSSDELQWNFKQALVRDLSS